MAIYLPASAEEQDVSLDELTPREIVAALDKHVVGQRAAKRAVAIALRNRQRRHKLPPDIADDITYHAHDVDDGLEAGLITLEQLEKLAFWKLAAARTREQYAVLDDGHFLRITIRNLLDLQAQDILREGHYRLEKHSPQTIAEVMDH